MTSPPHNSTEPTDEQLMGNVRDDACLSSFQQLFDRWSQRIHRLCLRMTGCWEDAEDLTQDVFSKLYRYRQRYIESASFGTYLWTIAINHSRDALRKANRQPSASRGQELDSLPSPTSPVPADWEEQTRMIRQALLELPLHYREVVVLRHYENLPFKQIADVLHLPAGTVASRMAKAMKLLARRLHPLQEELPS